MRKTPLKRKSKTENRKLQDALWAECKRITRSRYPNICFTCGKTGLEKSSWQTGHFIPNSVGGALLRYNLDNLRPQCYRCNIDLSGNGSEFYRRLVLENGQEYVDKLFILKHQTVKAEDHYRKLLIEYKKL